MSSIFFTSLSVFTDSFTNNLFRFLYFFLLLLENNIWKCRIHTKCKYFTLALLELVLSLSLLLTPFNFPRMWSMKISFSFTTRISLSSLAHTKIFRSPTMFCYLRVLRASTRNQRRNNSIQNISSFLHSTKFSFSFFYFLPFCVCVSLLEYFLKRENR